MEKMTQQFQGIPTEFEPLLTEIIEKKLKPTLVTVRSTIELTCFTKHGVRGIRQALKNALQWSKQEQQLLHEHKKHQPTTSTTSTASSTTTVTNDGNVNALQQPPEGGLSFKLIAPPEYQLTCETLEAIETMQFMKKLNQVLQEEIVKFGGAITIKEQPAVVNLDETRIALQEVPKIPEADKNNTAGAEAGVAAVEEKDMVDVN